MTTSTWVDAGPFRAHLQHLMAVGDLAVEEVAVLAGISVGVATSLAAGRQGRPLRRISSDTARALLALRPQHTAELRRCHVPAADPRMRLRRLLDTGLGLEELAEQLGTRTTTLAELADGSLEWCPGLLAVRLVALVRVGHVPAGLPRAA